MEKEKRAKGRSGRENRRVVGCLIGTGRNRREGVKVKIGWSGRETGGVVGCLIGTGGKDERKKDETLEWVRGSKAFSGGEGGVLMEGRKSSRCLPTVSPEPPRLRE